MAVRHTLFGTEDDVVLDSPELHHYTSVDGLRGIIQSRTLWATHYHGMNDSKEIEIFRDALREPLAKWLSDNLTTSKIAPKINYPLNNQYGEPSKDVDEVALKLIDLVVSKFIAVPNSQSQTLAKVCNPFIVSFCDHSGDSEYEKDNGLLSQWRGYGRGGGCCLVFDTKGLCDLLAKECDTHYILTAFVAPVTYSDDSIGIDSWFREFLPVFAEPLGIGEKYEGDFWDSPVVIFIAAVPLIKHRGFKEEREFRIVVTPVTDADMRNAQEALKVVDLPLKKLHQRTIREHSVNYVALFDGFKAALPIRRIIIGPSPHQLADQKLVCGIVGDKIPVLVSKTPYIA